MMDNNETGWKPAGLQWLAVVIMAIGLFVWGCVVAVNHHAQIAANQFVMYQ